MKAEIVYNSIPIELAALRDAGPEAMLMFVNDLTLATHRTAVRKIQRGPASGRFYASSVAKGVLHQASAPGEYPMSDSGRLANGIEFELPKSKTKPEGIVGTNVLYGKYLELKPSTMGGRPWLSRAFNETTSKADAMLAKVFKRLNKRRK